MQKDKEKVAETQKDRSPLQSQQKNERPKIITKGKRLFQVGGTDFHVYDKYEAIKQIGHGAYGVVISANNNKTNSKVAIKKVGNAYEDLIDAKRIVREIKLLSITKVSYNLEFFDHENIIKIIDIVKPEKRTGDNDIYIITDLMETDMHRVIYSRQDLTDEHIQYFTYQLLRGVLYIHSANVIHRDLKPSNLLLNKNCDLKICDLGLCRGYQEEDEFKTEYVVTRWYRAPEVILNASEYTKAVDIWSVGCIFAELLARSPLFPGDDYLDQVQRILAVIGTPSSEEMSFIGNQNARQYLKSLPKRIKQPLEKIFSKANPLGLDLLSKILTFNPEKRYTVEQCLSHPYFETLHNPEEEPICETPFDWSWDNFEPTKEILQSMVYDESLSFHPDKPKIQFYKQNIDKIQQQKKYFQQSNQ